MEFYGILWNFMEFRGISSLNFIAEISHIAIIAIDSDFKISVS